MIRLRSVRLMPLCLSGCLLSVLFSNDGRTESSAAQSPSKSFEFLSAVIDGLGRSYTALKLVNDEAKNRTVVDRMTANQNASIELHMAESSLAPFKSDKNDNVRLSAAATIDSYEYMRRSLAISLGILEKLDAAKSEDDLAGLNRKISEAKVLYQQASSALIEATTLAFGSAVVPDPKDTTNHVALDMRGVDKTRLLKAIESRFGLSLRNETPEDTGPLQAARLLMKSLEKNWRYARSDNEIGDKTPPSLTRSMEQFRDLEQRAEAGDALSQFNLGFAYHYGEGAAKDATKAVEWYRKAADQGNLGAAFMLGFIYRTGDGVKIDYAEALRWYQKAADGGDGASQSELGAMYENGAGVQVNYERAAYWYAKAVEGGYGYSNLGSLYKYGLGVPQDDRKAVDLYRRGAETGAASAQSNLGVMYATGRGVTRDVVEAYKWFTVAMKKGHKSAETNRDLLVKGMTSEQIAEGEGRATAFVPKENPARHKLPPRYSI
jgi:TPR repeat protein